MNRVLRQSTAAILKAGFPDATDGVTAETGLTISQADIQISKNGGTLAQTSEATPTTTHDADGYYPIPLTATDTGTLGRILVKVYESGALRWEWEGIVIPAPVYDALVLGTDVLTADVTQWLGDAVTSTVAGVPVADASYIYGDVTPAQNLALEYDGTGYAGGTIRRKVDVDQILATALTEGAAGRLAAAFKKLFDVATPLLVASDVMRGTDSAATEAKQDIIDGIVDAIKAKTDNLPASPAATGAKMDIVDAPNATALAAIGAKVEAMVLDEGDATALLAAIAAKVEEFLINEGDATATVAAIAAACNAAVVAGTVGTNVAAVKAKTDNLPASPAAVGSAMTLADDAITAAKFDETTAFPLKSADTGSTAVARTGADSDTLETLSDEIAAIEAGAGGDTNNYDITIDSWSIE